jgi:phospholipid/cholesterol/gamma-HCH transport system ATP-binding protein
MAPSSSISSPRKNSPDPAPAVISVRDLTMAYGDFLVQADLNFDVRKGEIFILMGGSGCGKSTLLKHMIGLVEPAKGTILYGDTPFAPGSDQDRAQVRRRIGVLYQQGALWSSMTLGENVALPLQVHTRLKAREIHDVVRYKLALVGLSGFEDFYPSEISGGMRKRAALARAMALDPEILFFDEPSAGLDPITSRRLDETILQIRESMGTTVVMVTHELDSLLELGDRAVFLGAREKTITAEGKPATLKENPPNDAVRAFLRREAPNPA